MVYCRKCGAANSDGDAYCRSCGAGHLSGERQQSSGWWEGDGWERSGAIWGLAFGIFLILLGLAVATGVNIWNYLLAIILVGIGAATLIGAVVGLWRSRK